MKERERRAAKVFTVSSTAVGQKEIRRTLLLAVTGFLVALVIAGGATADTPPDTLGLSTIDQTLVPTGDLADYNDLAATGEGEGYVVREELAAAEAARETRRNSLLYFGQLSDFQLADEESPARVEFLDFGPFSSAWRENDGQLAHQAEAMIRQINAFAPASPLDAADGSNRAMDFTINTGDAADSQQRNETEWVRTLAEGGTLYSGSGTDPATSGDATCALLHTIGLVPDGNAPEKYTGVMDYDDYSEGTMQFWDPDLSIGPFADFPTYPGLMDASQAPFEAAGLDVPHYLTFGNHDALVQGNAAANAIYESVATGCVKPMAPLTSDTDTLQEAFEGIAALDLSAILTLLTTDPTKIGLVPPDQGRQFVSKSQYKQIFRDGTQADAHGFNFIDGDEETASEGSAGYYAWNPEPGLRFISVDTVSEAGVIGPSANGNVDHPQFLWLVEQLEAAKAADELVVLFSHHAIPSLNADVADELAPPCNDSNDSHGHNVNPGCDPDPRNSEPIHLGADLEDLLHDYPNAIAWVAGHSHENTIEPYPNPSGEGGFWSIRVAAEADWPQQSRLLEIFDNEDGTISIFGTILDHASPSTSVPAETDMTGAGVLDIASVGRTIGYNETQYGGEACNPVCSGEPGDRNVELLLGDPRVGDPDPPDPPDPPRSRCGRAVIGTKGNDRLVGTSARNRLVGKFGRDRISGRRGDDCLRGGRGRDKLHGGAGDDRLTAASGDDRLVGGPGRDRMVGGRGNDRIIAMDGERDVVICGRGDDFVRSDFNDVLRGCERGVSGGP